jgi:hypothetical protein
MSCVCIFIELQVVHACLPAKQASHKEGLAPS